MASTFAVDLSLKFVCPTSPISQIYVTKWNSFEDGRSDSMRGTPDRPTPIHEFRLYRQRKIRRETANATVNHASRIAT